MGPRVELKQEPVSPLIVIKNLCVILLTSGLFFDITTGLHLIVQLVQWYTGRTYHAGSPGSIPGPGVNYLV